MDWHWILFIFLVFGGGDLVMGMVSGTGSHLSRVLSGRRKNAVLKAKIKTLEKERGRPGALTTLPAVNSDTDYLMVLLTRVQATDDALPQLPRQLRDDIDAVLKPPESYRGKEKHGRR